MHYFGNAIHGLNLTKSNWTDIIIFHGADVWYATKGPKHQVSGWSATKRVCAHNVAVVYCTLARLVGMQLVIVGCHDVRNTGKIAGSNTRCAN
jgi:hypothetical protein